MRSLTEGGEAKVIFSFALPMLAGNVFQQLYNLTDSWVVGQFVGTEALAAVGSSFSIVFLLTAMILGVTMGSGIMVSQFYGAGQMEKVRRTISTTYIYVLVATVALTVAGLLASRPLLRLLDTPDEVLPQATTYLQIIFAGLAMSFGYNAFSAVLRALGDSRTPLYFLVIAVLANVGLDIWFVAGLGWGVAGAAWATIISQAIAFAASWVFMQASRHEILHVHLRLMVFDRELFAQSMRIGLPQGAQQTMVAAGFMALTRIVNGFGTNALAAYTAAGRLDQFAGMPAMNFAMALTTFVGQNLGARKSERVRRGLAATLLMSGCFALAATLLMVFARTQLISLFSTDPEVIRIGSEYLTIVGLAYVLFSTMFVTGAVARGAGDTVFPMIVSLLVLWVVRIPLSAWLSSFLGTRGIWLGLPVAWFIGSAMNTIYYFVGRWRRMDIVGAGRAAPGGGAGSPVPGAALNLSPSRDSVADPEGRGGSACGRGGRHGPKPWQGAT